ncbi:MAG: hypothetical protein M1823_001482, partial [Watsoniomyces obsoletus]
RTTSPLPVYKSLKDTRNHPLWNPSSQSLANLEEDEAGRLRAFRKRFGRGWDAEGTSSSPEETSLEPGQEGDEEGGDVKDVRSAREKLLGNEKKKNVGEDDDAQDDGGLWDLISGFDTSGAGAGEAVVGGKRNAKGKGGKGQIKKGKK